MKTENFKTAVCLECGKNYHGYLAISRVDYGHAHLSRLWHFGIAGKPQNLHGGA